MARSFSKVTFMAFLIIFFFSAYVTAEETPSFSRNLSPLSLGLKREKLSHLHFYFHDIVTGPKPTAVKVAEAAMTNASSTGFGFVVMMDDALTVLPERSSKLVGNAQGIYASASQTEVGLLMVLNFVFLEGKYNGSSLSVLGRNEVFSAVRELPIVGGTGVFRFAPYVTAEEAHSSSRNLSPSSLGLKREKLSHLHFYFHDVVTGPKPTAVRVAQAATTNTSSTGFGFIAIIDDALTVLPEISSKLVGRAQGMYASASQTEVGLLMGLNFVFQERKYNGSSLSVLGRNEVFSAVREMPIVGGTGVFRFARGYAQARTHTFDTKTGYTVVEYNIYVFHY
ncbi:Dirigent protein 21 [Morella rubra]|uniref:Dirigent protein n=1 Tax=Morella rubra TaxID=262757 RepID=A0A6A1WB07_9ROSI|nr:Dirigent protein 21 [Morella rubra]